MLPVKNHFNPDTAWALRINQEIEACLLYLPEIRRIIHETQDPIERLEMRLLLNSLERPRGRLTQFYAGLDSIEKTEAREHLDQAPHFAFEKAMSLYLKEDYLGALEHFVGYRRYAHHPSDRAVAMMNEVFCLENLGFSNQTTLGELETLLSQVDDRSAKPFPAIENQLNYFKCVQKFKSGIFDFVNQSASALNSGLNQVTYFSVWASQLPFTLTSKHGNEDGVIEAHQKNPHFFQASYRLKTLIYNSHTSQGDQIRTSDLAERLYLWTWRWMSHPNSRNAGMTLRTLATLLESCTPDTASPFEYQLIQNSCLWITNLSPELKIHFSASIWKKLEEWMKDHRYAGFWFSFERLWIDALVQLKTQKQITPDLMELIEIEKLKLADSRVGTFMHQWVNHIALSENSVSPYSIETAIEIDPYRFTLKSPDQTLVHSEILTKTLHFFSNQPIARLDEFSHHVFSTKVFDPDLHAHQIQNIFTRLKRLIPGLKVGQKEKNVFFELPKNLSLVFRKGSLHTQSLIENAEFGVLKNLKLPHVLNARSEVSMFSQKAPPVRAVEKYVTTQTDGTFTRKEIEQKIGGSRASVIRRINTLVDKGKIQKIGKGKHTRYLITKGTVL